MKTQIYGTITKKDLEYQANVFMEKFNNANFKSKTSGRVQKINEIEIVENGMAVYFWCINMNNFAVCDGTKRQTYDRLQQMFMYISLHEHDTYINLSDFIVRR